MGGSFISKSSNRLESTEAQSINGSNQRMIKKRFREGTGKSKDMTYSNIVERSDIMKRTKKFKRKVRVIKVIN